MKELEQSHQLIQQQHKMAKKKSEKKEKPFVPKDETDPETMAYFDKKENPEKK